MIKALSEMNWQLIIGVLLVSCLVAYVGDRVGMRIGKKRISLFGLRPRDTSSIITALTGLLIALGTLTVLAVASDSVRTALFSMKYVQRQITELTGQLQESREEFAAMEKQLFESQSALLEKQQELFEIERRLEGAQNDLVEVRARLVQAELEKDDLEKETEGLRESRNELQITVASLRAEAESLREGLDEVREGRIVVFAGELLSQVVIPPGSSRPQVEILLAEGQARAAHFVALRFGALPEQVSLSLSEASRERLIESLSGSPYRQVLRFLSASNALGGEEVVLDPRTYVSRSVYQAGQILLTQTFPAGLKREAAENALYGLLRQVNALAVSDGVLPDPLHKTVGNLTATEFFEAIETLANRPAEARVTVVVDEETFSEGPVRVQLRVEDV
ncbi:MAG: DUF3084 domain-containing protein [Synergistaceae bacterium]|jgi:Skp family chaperone for outer membrane proteins|nr:DUF3084 domain-containing protein [Synergistaceae bacterium]